MSIELNNISSGYSTGLINENFQKLEQYINDSLLNRDGTETGEPNQMELDLDMNGFTIYNLSVDLSDDGSLLTIGDADDRYINVTGDTMEGALSMGSHPLYVREAVAPNEAVRREQLDQERISRIQEDAAVSSSLANETQARAAGDASLQDQLSGLTEIAAAERPIIQWHNQTIPNSITIPDNVNAFTAGPSIAIAEGQSITVGANSFWTIMDGREVGDVVVGSVENFDEGTL